VLTTAIRPHKRPLDNYIKIIGEVFLFFSWMIFLCKLVPFQKLIKESTVIASSQVSEFLTYGTILIYTLIGYNILYLILFLWDKVILKIIAYLIQRQ